MNFCDIELDFSHIFSGLVSKQYLGIGVRVFKLAEYFATPAGGVFQ